MPSVTTNGTYAWNFTVSNTGDVSFNNITYNDPAFPSATSNCPQTLAANSSQDCSGQVVAPSTAQTVTNTVSASASYTDGAGKTHNVTDQTTASITVTAPAIECPTECQNK